MLRFTSFESPTQKQLLVAKYECEVTANLSCPKKRTYITRAMHALRDMKDEKGILYKYIRREESMIERD